MPTLLLLRHAKSSWAESELDDFERPLNGRGRRDAPRIGDWLARSAYDLDFVLSSSSIRTRQSWAGVSERLDDPPEVRFEDRLYHASVGDILRVVRGLPAGFETVLILGHNPGIGRAMVDLTGRGPADQVRRLETKVPTGALAVLSWEGGWVDAARGCAMLEDYILPKDLADS